MYLALYVVTGVLLLGGVVGYFGFALAEKKSSKTPPLDQ